MSLEVRPRITPFLRRLSNLRSRFGSRGSPKRRFLLSHFTDFIQSQARRPATAGTTQKTDAPACVGNRL